MVGGESPALTQPHSESASFAAEEHPVMIPNAPSSPLWSLTDQADHRPSLPERAAHAIHDEPKAPSIAAPEIRSRTHMEDAPEPERAEGDDATPHEARKGWWQRRFKI
jgi:hypothetical protein